MEERVERLELAIRRWRYVSYGLVAGLVLFASLFSWREFGTRGTVKARFIQVIGSNGSKVVELSSNDLGGIIRTTNVDGASLFLAASDPKGRGSLATYNGKGSELVYVTATDTGGALAIMNNIGNDVVNLQSSMTNCGLMISKDYNGNSKENLSGSRNTPLAGSYPSYQ